MPLVLPLVFPLKCPSVSEEGQSEVTGEGVVHAGYMQRGTLLSV